MKLIILIFLACTSCLPDIDLEEKKINNNIYIIEEKDDTLIVDTGSNLSLKEISQVIKLRDLKEPTKNLILNITKTKNNIALIKPKIKLKKEHNYGLYINNNLKYILFPNEKPLLISHDLEKNNIIPKNRINFSFIFDNPIRHASDNLVELIKNSGEAIKISRINLSPDRKKVKINLDKNNKLEENNYYYFKFNDSLSHINNLEFSTTGQALILEEIKPIELDVGPDSIEINWLLNNNYNFEILIKEDLKDQSLFGFSNNKFINNLKPNTSYLFIARAQDFQEEIIISGGVFKTRSDLSLRFSEILINPDTHKNPEHEAEFIELFYAGKDAKKIDNLSLVINNHACEIISPENSVLIKPQEYLLIVGNKFDAEKAHVPQSTILVRLKQKSICKALSNSKPKVIKLVDAVGLIDRFGAYLWEGPPGNSIIRRDPRGLDDFDNYCYSDERGPTPGIANR